MAVSQVCFVHVLANLTQKALIWPPPHTFKVSVVILLIRKVQVRKWFKSHAFKKNTQRKKKPMKKRSVLRDERKEKTVQQLLWGRATTKKNSTDRADGLFTTTFVKRHTPKNTKLRSKHLANEVISPMQNNLGLNPHIWGWTQQLRSWFTHVWVFFTSWISFNHLCKANDCCFLDKHGTDVFDRPAIDRKADITRN